MSVPRDLDMDKLGQMVVVGIGNLARAETIEDNARLARLAALAIESRFRTDVIRRDGRVIVMWEHVELVNVAESLLWPKSSPPDKPPAMAVSNKGGRPTLELWGRDCDDNELVVLTAGRLARMVMATAIVGRRKS